MSTPAPAQVRAYAYRAAVPVFPNFTKVMKVKCNDKRITKFFVAFLPKRSQQPGRGARERPFSSFNPNRSLGFVKLCAYAWQIALRPTEGVAGYCEAMRKDR